MLPIVLHPDSSEFALSSIFSRTHDGRLHTLAIWSRKYSAAELNYNISDREALAIIESMEYDATSTLPRRIPTLYPDTHGS